VQKHSREGYNLAALLLFYLFLGNLSRRVEASKDKAGRGSGRVRGDSTWWSCLGC
jgi:hypothetical protein